MLPPWLLMLLLTVLVLVCDGACVVEHDRCHYLNEPLLKIYEEKKKKKDLLTVQEMSSVSWAFMHSLTSSGGGGG